MLLPTPFTASDSDRAPSRLRVAVDRTLNTAGSVAAALLVVALFSFFAVLGLLLAPFGLTSKISGADQ